MQRLIAGAPESGKSTFVEALQAAIGSTASFATPLSRLKVHGKIRSEDGNVCPE